MGIEQYHIEVALPGMFMLADQSMFLKQQVAK
jgi:hypothetical protein